MSPRSSEHFDPDLEPRPGGFAPGFEARVARFARRAAAERRTPRDEPSRGRARQGACGVEFAGRRRYRPGDDLRAFDWDAYARGLGEHVRLARPEGGERWCVALDASLSMAVADARGRPKLALARELAYALCALGVAFGGEVTLALPGAALAVRGARDLARALAELARLDCASDSGLARALAGGAGRRARRLILISDLLGQEPAALGEFCGARARVDAFAVLAPLELTPLEELAGRNATSGGLRDAAGLSVEWRDPETSERHAVVLDAHAAARYGRELAAHLELWRASLARRRGAWIVADAEGDFEPHLARWLDELP